MLLIRLFFLLLMAWACSAGPILRPTVLEKYPRASPAETALAVGIGNLGARDEMDLTIYPVTPSWAVSADKTISITTSPFVSTTPIEEQNIETTNESRTPSTTPMPTIEFTSTSAFILEGSSSISPSFSIENTVSTAIPSTPTPTPTSANTDQGMIPVIVYQTTSVDSTTPAGTTSLAHRTTSTKPLSSVSENTSKKASSIHKEAAPSTSHSELSHTSAFFSDKISSPSSEKTTLSAESSPTQKVYTLNTESKKATKVSSEGLSYSEVTHKAPVKPKASKTATYGCDGCWTTTSTIWWGSTTAKTATPFTESELTTTSTPNKSSTISRPVRVTKIMASSETPTSSKSSKPLETILSKTAAFSTITTSTKRAMSSQTEIWESSASVYYITDSIIEWVSHGQTTAYSTETAQSFTALLSESTKVTALSVTPTETEISSLAATSSATPEESETTITIHATETIKVTTTQPGLTVTETETPVTVTDTKSTSTVTASPMTVVITETIMPLETSKAGDSFTSSTVVSEKAVAENPTKFTSSSEKTTKPESTLSVQTSVAEHTSAAVPASTHVETSTTMLTSTAIHTSIIMVTSTSMLTATATTTMIHMSTATHNYIAVVTSTATATTTKIETKIETEIQATSSDSGLAVVPVTPVLITTTKTVTVTEATATVTTTVTKA